MNTFLIILIYLLIGAIESFRFIVVYKIYKDFDKTMSVLNQIIPLWPVHYMKVLTLLILQSYLNNKKDDDEKEE